MKALGATALTTDDALDECDDWIRPTRVKVQPDGKFYKIVQFDYRQRAVADWEQHADLLL